MQATRMSTQRARTRQKSCTECRRRRQKCNPRKDGPCGNCARRYPPVECIMPEHVEQSLRKPKIESEVNFSDVQDSKDSSSMLKGPATSERPYVSPYPILAEKSSSQKTRLKDILKIEREASSSSSSTPSSSLTDRDGYFEISPTPKIEQSNDVSPGLDSESSMVMVGHDFAGSPKAFAGVLTAVSSINGLPIKSTMRNAELFQLFHQFVIPNLVSLDGRGTIPALFLQEMLPWMIQSPLMPNIAILMASYTQALDQGFEVIKYSEPLGIKAHVLSLINQFLKQDFNVVGGEALRAVIHLVILEWFWGAEVSLWAHMKGLKQMIKLRGGFAGMQDPLLVQVLILTDYELACCFERDLYLQPPPSADEDLLIPVSYPERFISPLLDSPTTFRKTIRTLGLSFVAVDILEDVRTLTLSINPDSPTKTSTAKVQSTAAWFHKQFQIKHIKPIVVSDIDLVFETIRLAALIYSSCIMSLTPFCSQRNQPIMQELYSNILQVPLARWKEIPGIFLWILLVVAPSSENDAQGRFLKKKMAVAGMSIGLEDFNLATGHLRAFWKVQRWIARESQKIEEVVS